MRSPLRFRPARLSYTAGGRKGRPDFWRLKSLFRKPLENGKNAAQAYLREWQLTCTKFYTLRLALRAGG